MLAELLATDLLRQYFMGSISKEFYLVLIVVVDLLILLFLIQ